MPTSRKGRDRRVDILRRMRRRHLRADARLALRDHRIEEAGHIDAPLIELRRHLLGELGLAQHDRNDRMLAGQQVEARLGHAGPEPLHVGEQPFAQIIALFAPGRSP